MKTVSFSQEKNGYNIEQVDKYIQMISEQYKALYDEYTTLKNEHTPAQTPPQIPDLLVEAKQFSQKIINEAEQEAAIIAKQNEARLMMLLNSQRKTTALLSEAKKNIENILLYLEKNPDSEF